MTMVLCDLRTARIGCILFFLWHYSSLLSLADALIINGNVKMTSVPATASATVVVKPTIDRRDLLSRVSTVTATTFGLLGGGVVIPTERAAAAAEDDGTTTTTTTTTTSSSSPPKIPTKDFVVGTVVLPSDYSPPLAATDSTTTTTTTPALYITCRPDRPDNVPKAILSGTRGKPPPVLVARYENPSFPFDFILTTNDLTVEGLPTNTIEDDFQYDYWWNKDNLIVSARLDSDGVAATRSPEDLVGRTVWNRGQEKNDDDGNDNKKNKLATVIVPLQGRGPAGKFVTGGAK